MHIPDSGENGRSLERELEEERRGGVSLSSITFRLFLAAVRCHSGSQSIERKRETKT